MFAALSLFALGVIFGACAATYLLTRPSSHEDMAEDWRTTGEPHVPTA